MSSDIAPDRIRAPRMAGSWYPAGREACADVVEACLRKGRASPVPEPKVVVAPHAGFSYSGEIAGTAFKGLASRARRVRRVVLVGPAHRVAFKGLATTGSDAWATPLGAVPVDWAALRASMALPGFAVMDRAFENEHSLEVHLPFLQRVLDGFSIVPILVGDAGTGLVREALERVWGGPETLISVSSDLSHFLDYAAARALDGETARHIELLAHDRIDASGACGHRALAGALSLARSRDLRATGLDTRNSGDTSGRRDRVVGYGAFAMEHAASARLPDDDRQRLLDAARYALRFGAERGREPRASLGGGLPASLTAHRASFVSLKAGGKLRGCVGSVVAHRPLLLDVISNAWKAGFADKRFAPLAVEELAGIELEVSVLSFPRPMRFDGEADLVRQLRPDIDGLVLQDKGRRGVFLPSVWEGVPRADAFVRHLKRKAGLAPDHWSDTLRAFRYTAERFGDPAGRPEGRAP